MKVMVIVKASKESETGALPDPKMLEEMGKYNEELVKAGIMLAGEGLRASQYGARVRFSGSQRTVVDGPFAETKELIAGFWIWQVKSMKEALEWVKRCPNPHNEDSEIEVRPIFELDDFAAVDPTGEHRAAEKKLIEKVKEYRLEPTFVKGKELLIAGLGTTVPYGDKEKISRLWDKFAPQIGEIADQVENKAYGVCHNFQEGKSFDYLAGVEVSSEKSLPADFKTVKIPVQTYAVFKHAGDLSELPKTLDAIWGKWLPNSGYEAVDTGFFERYTEEFNAKTGRDGIEVWFPVKKI